MKVINTYIIRSRQGAYINSSFLYECEGGIWILTMYSEGKATIGKINSESAEKMIEDSL